MTLLQRHAESWGINTYMQFLFVLIFLPLNSTYPTFTKILCYILVTIALNLMWAKKVNKTFYPYTEIQLQNF